MNSKLDNKIEVLLHDRDDYVNIFNNDRISSDLDDYILNETKTIGLKEHIIIEIKSELDMSDDEKNKLRDMIKLSFYDDIIELNVFEKTLLKKNIIFMIIGVLFILMYFLFNEFIIINELLLIIGWLFVSESIYALIFGSSDNNIKIIKRKQLVNSDIIFK